ncbi:PhzF family phenazine biosynthesis protein [Fulvivirga lutimaris]|uniref:PhzF family phenazine biosynthesis protein n=1 Tax=Fulvivirga lutimaris TaxID=1819566 RepID=UPI0012BD2B6E|nr:PhzF family phenazine biosynthesis protein [Fulvivirga lutimaris]MTI40245.1 PhzF family phenazine biosynthesis protein [Fulvivirga lutimaris]
MTTPYFLVDVFSKKPFSGNGLTIFPSADKMDKEFMQVLTQEMRQFESIFYHALGQNRFRAYIFTMEEELNFAGHPLLGLAALIHKNHTKEKSTNSIRIDLNTKTVDLQTTKKDGFFTASMNQGIPQFLFSLNKTQEMSFLSDLNLTEGDKYDGLNMEVITTGLPYLIIPVKAHSLSKVKVLSNDLNNKLSKIGAKFFYVLDVENKRGRTWDNFGLVEDVATGSAAGPVGAYLVKNGLEQFNTEIKISQGEFVNRESEIKVVVKGIGLTFKDVFVEGDVVQIAHGTITKGFNKN